MAARHSSVPEQAHRAVKLKINYALYKLWNHPRQSAGNKHRVSKQIYKHIILRASRPTLLRLNFQSHIYYFIIFKAIFQYLFQIILYFIFSHWIRARTPAFSRNPRSNFTYKYSKGDYESFLVPSSSSHEPWHLPAIAQPEQPAQEEPPLLFDLTSEYISPATSATTAARTQTDGRFCDSHFIFKALLFWVFKQINYFVYTLESSLVASL